MRGVELNIRPLHEAGSPAGSFSAAAPPGSAWQIVEAAQPEKDRDWLGLSDWDLTHELARTLARKEIAFDALEPDRIQTFPFSRERRITEPDGSPFAGAERSNEPVPQAPNGDGTFGWHLDAMHSGLEQARTELGPSPSAIVVAHLDTGYDPDHKIKPRLLDTAHQRNFIDGDRPNDATDRDAPGPRPQSLGHGTGTLGLLAGGPLTNIRPADKAHARPLGGAPDATVIPVRVANYVAQFSTSTIAAGLAYAHDQQGVDVVTMSLGGYPSHAWAEEINRCYERGIVVVAAAGNNFNGLPVTQIVWPARFARVIAACGVMSDGKPYDRLGLGVMTGNYGPTSKMDTALAAFTPNVPWAVFGSHDRVAPNGQGTSAATPQIAAAAALWLARHKEACLQQGITGWRLAEAVRHALFTSASQHGGAQVDPKLGRGLLNAIAAVRAAPLDAGAYHRAEKADATWAIWSAISGTGMAQESRRRVGMRQQLLQLECLQAASQSRQVLEAVPELEMVSSRDFRKVAEILLDQEEISTSLREWLSSVGRSGVSGTRTADPPPPPPPGGEVYKGQALPPLGPVQAPLTPSRSPSVAIVAQPPNARRLRVYASDPADAATLATARISTATVSVRWEPRELSRTLPAGPVGEYVEVVDVDPASGLYYKPVELDDRMILAQSGLAPDVANPQFHQQMVYAVAMRTVDRFEQALGRSALWAQEPKYYTKKPYTSLPNGDPARLRAGFVRRLRIYPHALREDNAYYSPDRVALLFGYFTATRTLPDGSSRTGDTIFTCLSHDIIAHETTHALLDGLHPSFRQATNGDVHALHEGFADIVALFQHFALEGVLREEIRVAGGVISKTRLGQLAREFGRARSGTAALRDAIATTPDKANYLTAKSKHERGAVLVAAVFDAFMRLYEARVADLQVVATGGSGIHAPGQLHPTLVDLLAIEARKTAEHVLNMCIRALDYMPPVDPTFSDYLRALVTADSDLVPEDARSYRVAFIESFASRFIFPDDVNSSSTEALRWRGPGDAVPRSLAEFVGKLPLVWSQDSDRFEAYTSSRRCAERLHGWISENIGQEAGYALGLDMQLRSDNMAAGHDPNRPYFEVHSIRPSVRTTPSGGIRRDIVIVLRQRTWQKFDPASTEPRTPANSFKFYSGSTLICELDGDARARLRYVIRKSAEPRNEPGTLPRLQRARAFMADGSRDSYSLYFNEGAASGEPFAAGHRGH